MRFDPYIAKSRVQFSKYGDFEKAKETDKSYNLPHRSIPVKKQI